VVKTDLTKTGLARLLAMTMVTPIATNSYPYIIISTRWFTTVFGMICHWFLLHASHSVLCLKASAELVIYF